MKRWDLFVAVLVLPLLCCVNDPSRPASPASITTVPDGSADPIEPSEKQEMPLAISRESCLWLAGVPLGQTALLWFASAEARLVEIGDDGVHGVLRFPSDVHPDTGASLGTTFRLDGDLAELQMGSQTIDQTDRREYSEALFAWEHFVYQAPALFPLPDAACAVQAIIRVPIARVACEEAPAPGGVRNALRWDAPVPPRYLSVTAGPIAVYSDPDTGALLGIELTLRETLTSEVCSGIGSSHCEIHFLTMSGGRPKVVVLEYSDDSGERITEHRRYDVGEAS